jgi:hypothetical protein
MEDYLAILSIIVGNGVLITAVSLVLNHYEKKSETRLEARRDAHDFYFTLYSNIANLEELISAHRTSKSNGKAQVFIRNQGYIELPRNQIAAEFSKAYEVFLSYYMEKKCSGYEIFLNKRLRNLLSDFQSLFRSGINLENMTRYGDANHIVSEIREQMEKAFGLK